MRACEIFIQEYEVRMTMKLQILFSGLIAATVAVSADIPWPSDFDQQVADNHPAPSGTQIAASDGVVSVDGRVAVADVSALALACAEGRALTFWCSNEALIDALARAGLMLFIR